MTYKELVDAYMLLAGENDLYKKKLSNIKTSLKGTIQIMNDSGNLEECADILESIINDIKDGNVL